MTKTNKWLNQWGKIFGALLVLASLGLTGCKKVKSQDDLNDEPVVDSPAEKESCSFLDAEIAICNVANKGGMDCAFDYANKKCAVSVACEQLDKDLCQATSGCNHYADWRDASKTTCLSSRVIGSLINAECSDLTQEHCELDGLAKEKCVYLDSSCRAHASLDRNGFTSDGWHLNGSRFDDNGYDVNRLNARGFLVNKQHKNGTLRDDAGYDFEGFLADGKHLNGTKYGDEGYDIYGFLVSGEHRNGTDRDDDHYDVHGFLATGQHRNGTLRDADGYNVAGFFLATGQHRNGTPYGDDGYNFEGFLATGVHRNGTLFSEKGFNLRGVHRDTATSFDPAGNNKGGHNRATLSAYAGSEAETLRIGYRFRGGGPNPGPGWVGYDWGVDTYVHNGQAFCNRDNPLGDALSNWQIVDAGLANRISIALGAPFAVNEWLSFFAAGFILDPALKLELENLENNMMLGAVDPRANWQWGANPRDQLAATIYPPLPPAQAAYKQYILDTIEANRFRLGIGLNAEPSEFAHVAPGSRDAVFMENLLDAIEHDNESKFVVNMAMFYGVFGADNRQGRAFFIDKFAELFVTKKFPNIYFRASYFHFILRCGSIL